MSRPESGTALVVTLVLLSGLGALALAAAAAAMTALALASHQQMAQFAFEAAEAGIVRALAQAAVARREAVLPETAHSADAAYPTTFQTETRAYSGPGALPAGFSVGENADTFAAKHYFIVADGRAGRGTRLRLEQGFYLVVPSR